MLCDSVPKLTCWSTCRHESHCLAFCTPLWMFLRTSPAFFRQDNGVIAFASPPQALSFRCYVVCGSDGVGTEVFMDDQVYLLPLRRLTLDTETRGKRMLADLAECMSSVRCFLGLIAEGMKMGCRCRTASGCTLLHGLARQCSSLPCIRPSTSCCGSSSHYVETSSSLCLHRLRRCLMR